MIIAIPQSYGHPDNRRFQRVGLSLSGRYMLSSKIEHPCRTVNISPGGMLLSGPETPKIGEKVVVYIDALGRFEGSTVRIVDGGGFAITLKMPPAKRDRLADQLTWFANRAFLKGCEERRHERFTPLLQRVIVKTQDGKEHIMKIKDLSLSGVAIESATQPPLGTPFTVGSTPATVVRHFPGGFAGEFIVPFDEGQVDELTRL
jgi:hypothetical protein